MRPAARDNDPFGAGAVDGRNAAHTLQFPLGEDHTPCQENHRNLNYLGSKNET